jgi:hypothetical protein
VNLIALLLLLVAVGFAVGTALQRGGLELPELRVIHDR